MKPSERILQIWQENNKAAMETYTAIKDPVLPFIPRMSMSAAIMAYLDEVANRKDKS